MVRGLGILWLAAVVGCGSGTPAPAPVLVVDIGALTAEYLADPAATREKYANSRVELTGPLDSVRTDDPNVVGLQLRFRPAPGRTEAVEVLFHLSQEAKILSLVPGTTITVRGVLDGKGLSFGKGELNPTESPPATTLAALLAEAKNPDAFRQKYTNGGLKLTGKVQEISRKPPVLGVGEILMEIGDDAILDRFVRVRVRTNDRTDQRALIVAIKRGDTVTVVGRVDKVDPPGQAVLSLEHAFILP